MWRQYWAFVGNLLALKKRAGSKIGSVQTGVNEQCAQVCDILPVAPMLLLHNIWQFEWAHIHFQTLHCTQRETTASTYGSEIFRDTKSAAKSADLGTTRLNHRFVKVRHCKLVSQPAQTFGHSSYYIKNKFHSNALTSLVLLPIFFFFSFSFMATKFFYGFLRNFPAHYRTLWHDLNAIFHSTVQLHDSQPQLASSLKCSLSLSLDRYAHQLKTSISDAYIFPSTVGVPDRPYRTNMH